jgi:hypothetical protein
MDKLRANNPLVHTVRFGSSRAESEEIASPGEALLSPDLRRNFTMPPKERALECINVLLNLARNNLSVSQKNLHAAKRGEDGESLAQWKWESLHWLRRCGKWSNAKRKVSAR